MRIAVVGALAALAMTLTSSAVWSMTAPRESSEPWAQPGTDTDSSTRKGPKVEPDDRPDLPKAAVDKSTFVTRVWKCKLYRCFWEEKRGDHFIGTWSSAQLRDDAGNTLPSYAYIAGRWQPAGADPDTYLYWVYAWAPDAAGSNWQWRPACTDDAGAMQPAMPLQGTWDHRTGARMSVDGNTLSGACRPPGLPARPLYSVLTALAKMIAPLLRSCSTSTWSRAGKSMS